MTVVWKKSLSLVDGTDQTIDLPAGANVIHAREQFNAITIWFECDPNADLQPRRFQIVLTGGSVGVNAGRPVYRGTCTLDGGRFIVHVYEIVSANY